MSRQPSRQIEVTGRYRIASAASDVWSELNNPEALGFAIRHCEHVERLAPHRYRARLKVGVGPVRVPVHAEIEVIPESPPERYALACSMSLRMLGEARAESLVTMLEAGGTVDLDYRAMVAVEGASPATDSTTGRGRRTQHRRVFRAFRRVDAAPPAGRGGRRPVSEAIAGYYAASRREAFSGDPFEAGRRFDVVVIGGGLTGLNAALELARRGVAVCVLERHAVGWGASGRSGGQIIAGPGCDMNTLERSLGRAAARELWALCLAGMAELRGRIARHRIDCDLADGHLQAAHNRREAERLRREAEHRLRTTTTRCAISTVLRLRSR
ncbi:MAG: FAD-dependent oxidoreductase [Gammaproteobacteria bacterium]|nr:FAD-dependent oxidoreductase [Gammaproteobacteria bacterium]